MEKPLHTAKDLIKQRLNFIVVAILCIINIVISLFSFAGDAVLRPMPATFWGWLLWFVGVLIPPTIGLMVIMVLRNQGIRDGHKQIKDTHDEYTKLLHKEKEFKPRSMKEYQTQNLRKDLVWRYTIALVLSFFMVSIIISADLNALISMLINTVLFLGWGLFQMLEAERYVTDELVVWYRCEIDRIKNPPKPPEKPKQITIKEFDTAMQNMLKYTWTQEFYDALANLERYIKGEGK